MGRHSGSGMRGATSGVEGRGGRASTFVLALASLDRGGEGGACCPWSEPLPPVPAA